MTRIYLSPPHMTGAERKLVEDAFDSNWIAPLGPHVTALTPAAIAGLRRRGCTPSSTLDFVQQRVRNRDVREAGVGHACALSSGTGGIRNGPRSSKYTEND
ncbi:MAG: hypothetical protein R6V85_16175 [Polyangia bacterium]